MSSGSAYFEKGPSGISSNPTSWKQPTAEFVVVIGAITLAATILHAAEAGVWAWAYKSLGALPDYSTAMLYSLKCHNQLWAHEYQFE
jgi:hypothetical protein